MILIKRTVYQCEHCKNNKRTPKIYFNRDRMHAHEANCFYNSERKTCFTCGHKIRNENKVGRNITCGFENKDYSKCYSFSDCVEVNCKNWEPKEEQH